MHPTHGKGNFHAAPASPLSAGQPRRCPGPGGRGRAGKRRLGGAAPSQDGGGSGPGSAAPGAGCGPQGSPGFHRLRRRGRWGRADFGMLGCAGCVGGGGSDRAVGGDCGISSALPPTPFKDTAHDALQGLLPSAARVISQPSSKFIARLAVKIGVTPGKTYRFSALTRHPPSSRAAVERFLGRMLLSPH